jgi:4-alpha-glucanotransferase
MERLLELRGIEPGFWEHTGEYRSAPPASLHQILRELGHAPDDPARIVDDSVALDEAAWREVLPPVIVYRSKDGGAIPITVLRPLLEKVTWRLTTEDGVVEEFDIPLGSFPVGGERQLGELAFCRLEVTPPNVPGTGYHKLEILDPDGRKFAETMFIVVPDRCYEPKGESGEERIWGLAVQLYTLRSLRNWGIGDFRDLQALVIEAATRGADFIGVNPLHAQPPGTPEHCSPYSPYSRHFLNALYIAPDAVAEFEGSSAVQSLLRDGDFIARLRNLRKLELVDYAAVAACKHRVLRLLFRDLESNPGSDRWLEFSNYIRNAGQRLKKYAVLSVIDEFDLKGVGDLAAEHGREIRYQMYLQWVANGQLADAQRVAHSAGMKIGLYQDLAVGVQGAGVDARTDEELYVPRMTIGAPPDAFATSGQDWGMPPMNPQVLRGCAYRPFIELLRANMPRGGALRIDHVMALHRLWWIPAGTPPAEGAYVRYPLEDLMGIIALESQRQRCMVIGEDLGTVPDCVREAMERYGLYPCKVFLFERDDQGDFRPPGDYPRRSLASLTTHDLPPLAGYWNEVDISLLCELGLLADATLRDSLTRERGVARDGILAAIEESDSLSASDVPDRVAAAGIPLAPLYRLVASGNSFLMAVRPEEVLGEELPVNLPGTHLEYPNWRRKMVTPVEQLFSDTRFADICSKVDQARRGSPTSMKRLAGS